MAGKRMVHDRICESQKMNKISFYAEALWTRLLTKADDNGNYFRDYRRVHANCMLEKNLSSEVETEKALVELADAGLIEAYRADERDYLHISNFHDFQELRNDRYAVIQHPIHPVKMGGAYLTEDTRSASWADQGKRERIEKPNGAGVVPVGDSTAKPSGIVAVSERIPSGSRADTDESHQIKVKSKDKVSIKSNGDDELTNVFADAKKGDWDKFCKRFRDAAGGSKDFKRFEANAKKFAKLCEESGEQAVLSVIKEWVQLKGGKDKTKKNPFSAKNFLEDAEDLIHDAAEVKEQPQDSGRLPRLKAPD